MDATQPLGVESHFIPETNHTWRHSSSHEVHFRWNEIFHPWERTPFPYHLEISRPFMAGFPMTVGERELEKFTVVVMSYKRPVLLRRLLAGLNGLDRMDRVCI